MISRIKGRIREKRDLCLLLDVGEMTYEVMIPPAVMSSMDGNLTEPVELITYHYYQVEPSRSTPVLIGFSNEIEKEFFEKFITVSGVGPKAACKALALPFSTIAGAIDSGDTKLLMKLPGIGERKAKEIIAKLQGRVGKFGLIQDKETAGQEAVVKEDVKEEALSVLLQLQYKRNEAVAMIEKAIARNVGIKTTEDILNEVYRFRSEVVGGRS